MRSHPLQPERHSICVCADSQAEKEAAEAAANAARLIEQKRSQLAQVQSQRGKAKAGAASACGTKRKQSAAALSDNSNVAAKSHSEKGTVRPHFACIASARAATAYSAEVESDVRQDYVGRRLVRLVAGLTKGKIVNYKEASDTYEILFKDKDRLELTLDQIVHGGIVQLTANKRPNFTSVEMSQRF